MADTSTAAAVACPGPSLVDDPFSFEILADPTSFQTRLREADRVVYLSKYGAYAIGRYDDVHSALMNWQELISGQGVGLNKPYRAQGILPSDPPRHDALRHVLSPILSARAMRALGSDCRDQATALVDELLAGHASGDVVEVDGHREIGSVFPLRFFPRAAGIDAHGTENLLPYADHLFNALGPRNELVIEGESRIDELAAWAETQCGPDAVRHDGFAAQIWQAVDRGDTTPEQAALLVRSLFSAGVDTTTYGVSALLYALAAHPDQWEALRSNPNLVHRAFDEALRWESPVQLIFRTAATDIAFGESVVPKGSKVMLCFASANRDPRKFDNPATFDLSRDPSGQLGFGMGIHQCVGQHAARLQAETLLRALLDRVERIELAAPVVRHHNNVLRGWESIPLRLQVL